MLSSLLSLGLVIAPVSLAERTHYLTCEDYMWIAEGLDRSENISEQERTEVRTELIATTDPTCFQ